MEPHDIAFWMDADLILESRFRLKPSRNPIDKFLLSLNRYGLKLNLHNSTVKGLMERYFGEVLDADKMMELILSSNQDDYVKKYYLLQLPHKLDVHQPRQYAVHMQNNNIIYVDKIIDAESRQSGGSYFYGLIDKKPNTEISRNKRDTYLNTSRYKRKREFVEIYQNYKSIWWKIFTFGKRNINKIMKDDKQIWPN